MKTLKDFQIGARKRETCISWRKNQFRVVLAGIYSLMAILLLPDLLTESTFRNRG